MALPEINVDFSNVDDDDQVVGLLERAPENVVSGDEVLAVDREGNQCRGRVAEVDAGNGLIYLALDWDTWIDREDFATWSMAFVLSPMSGNGHGNGASVAESERTAGRVHSLV
jgi:hypothetical protein